MRGTIYMKACWLFLPLLLVPCAAAAQEAPQAGTPTDARWPART
jgi:hypothetical protein